MIQIRTIVGVQLKPPCSRPNLHRLPIWLLFTVENTNTSSNHALLVVWSTARSGTCSMQCIFLCTPCPNRCQVHACPAGSCGTWGFPPTCCFVICTSHYLPQVSETVELLSATVRGELTQLEETLSPRTELVAVVRNTRRQAEAVAQTLDGMPFWGEVRGGPSLLAEQVGYLEDYR